MTDPNLALVSQAVAEQPELLLPVSGQLVDLRQPAQVADALEQVRQAVRELGELRGLLESVLRLEGQRLGTKTLRLGDVEATISGGSKTEYDGNRLRIVLREAGLPEERLNEAVPAIVTVTHKPNAAVLRQLSAGNELYADLIAGCRTTVEVPWRVSTRRR